jgi:REP element-mobilizing transposase RayT
VCRECENSLSFDRRPLRSTYRGLVPRAARAVLPDGYFHAVARGAGRRAIYRDDADRILFARLLAYTVGDHAWRVLATCLMGNHYHLVVETRREQLSDGMHRLNGRYAQAFNTRHARWGHVFGDRFGVRLLDEEERIVDVCRYVVDNPVRAGLCDRAEQWPWSRLTLEAGVGVSPFSLTRL